MYIKYVKNNHKRTVYLQLKEKKIQNYELVDSYLKLIENKSLFKVAHMVYLHLQHSSVL